MLVRCISWNGSFVCLEGWVVDRRACKKTLGHVDYLEWVFPRLGRVNKWLEKKIITHTQKHWDVSTRGHVQCRKWDEFINCGEKGKIDHQKYKY